MRGKKIEDADERRYFLSRLAIQKALQKERYLEYLTVKALLSPRGAYLILYTSEGGLIERGFIQKVR